MTFRDLAKTALGNLTRHKVRTILSGVGVMVGVIVGSRVAVGISGGTVSVAVGSTGLGLGVRVGPSATEFKEEPGIKMASSGVLMAYWMRVLSSAKRGSTRE